MTDTEEKPTLAALHKRADPPAPMNGNTKWASNYARSVKAIVSEASNRAPRSQQVHIGPSELGVACDRQVVGKLIRTPKVNQLGDPWASIVGTAIHAWLDDAFQQYNTREGVERFLTETRVAPLEGHEGTGDLYDGETFTVADHKCLGLSTLGSLRREGPPRKYIAQLFLYALGFEKAGKRVDRVALIAYPRTESSLDGMYVWEAPFDDTARALLAEVFADTQRRKDYAELIKGGLVDLGEVPATPGEECTFCPLYRPSAKPRADGSFGGCRGRKM